MTRVFWGVFAASALANLVFILTGKKTAAAAAKVCLMPALAAVFAAGSGAPFSAVPAALFFAWLGDILLAGGGSGRRIIAGLVSFLICHALYVVIFFRLIPEVNITLLAVSAAALAVYAVIFFRRLRFEAWLKSAGETGKNNAFPGTALLYPVLVYGVTLALMALSALQAAAGGFGGLPLAAGALCFVLSDSLLAFFTISGGGKSTSGPALFFIMLFYIAAQGLIVAALLREA